MYRIQKLLGTGRSRNEFCERSPLSTNAANTFSKTTETTDHCVGLSFHRRSITNKTKGTQEELHTNSGSQARRHELFKDVNSAFLLSRIRSTPRERIVIVENLNSRF
ncbi:hypothetical protein AVEN_91560-1 [Araneus ventricosus]|uniref:Uncharacterized protein n=1 Tax=Araneus ventricosus TaxID=182803 RepID=A0A4Y2LJ08_ARAVE|nr:hypothetical protein AVEN_91560-1 [Araneus ventricosus]